MPSVTVHPSPLSDPGEAASPADASPLPSLLQTPLGLAIVEVQGTLNLPARKDSEDLTHIGHLEFPLLANYSDSKAGQEGPWMKKVYFYVGQHQRLTGELKKLPKPLAVVKKRESTGSVPYGETVEEELEIADIIKWKIFFGGRPEFV